MSEELCDDPTHGMEGSLKAFCARCMRATFPKTRAPINLAPEEVLIPVTNHEPGRWFHWRPYKENLSSVPPDSTWVHISGTYSTRHVEELLRHCRDLRLIEIAPSTKEDLSRRTLAALKARGVGLSTYRLEVHTTRAS